MVSLKDYAKAKGVSYEAVRQSVVRYKKDLAGHISVDGKTQFLDDYAVDFLDTKRSKNPIVIHQESTSEELDRLKEENTLLLHQLLAAKNKIIELQENKDKLLIAESSLRRLEAAEIEAKSEIKALKKEMASAEQEAKAREDKLKLEFQIELAREQNRPLSWKERIFGKRGI